MTKQRDEALSTAPIKRWAGAAALALGLALSSGPAWAADMASDPWLTTKVKIALLTASDVDGLDINVDTVAGTVTLHGTASTASEKERASQLAREVDGVKEVRNLIQVVPESAEEAVSMLDDDLRDRVEQALDDDPRLADSSIRVSSVNQGAVLLEGKASSLSAHLGALETARGVKGVKRVDSQIESPDKLADSEIWRDSPDVAAQAGASGLAQSSRDMWITSAAKVRLMATEVSPFDVNVDTRNGVVTLFGRVDSEQAKRTAEAEVRKVDGVKDVENELQVVPESQQAAVERADEQIQKSVEEQLSQRLSDSNIDVEVSNGVVRLTGSVPSQEDRLAALTTARRGEGVRSVVGDLRVERN